MSGEPTLPAVGANRFDRHEWAGAFGDLGTLIPFVIAYLALLDLDPAGVLLAFGLASIVCGFVYRTPFPVQPMKAIGAVATTQAAQTYVVTAGAVHAAGWATGAIWLVLGLTGTARRIASLVSRPVVKGIIVGLGVGFVLSGAKMMAGSPWIGLAALAGTLLLFGQRRVPVMFVLLVFGALAGWLTDPTVADRLAGVRPEFRWPLLSLPEIRADEWMVGLVFLALPQLPLTLGNAIIAVAEENNRLFPDRPVTRERVAVSTGLLNLGGAALGGVPMCHGAGGMAGHVRFGARTGGAPIILGAVLVAVALFFSASVGALLALFPPPVLGVILLLAGAELAWGARSIGATTGERVAALVTAACAVWNVGVAFLAGSAVVAVVRWRERERARRT
ncbi:MAG: putative sulfate/molybdate transporter [Burkholderiales bacterium]|nr:putative sulfate/molybdate transporter [Burkholderiales bacterium]